MPRQPRKSASQPRQPAPRDVPVGHVQWLVDRLHVGTSPTGVVREMSRRMPRRLWRKEDRRKVYRIALKLHRQNQHLYRTVTGSI